MRAPGLYGQLPVDLRLFAALYGAQAPRRGRVAGARSLFNLLARFNEWFAREHTLRLEVADKVVFLDRQDPRMLQVPRELDGTSSIARWIETFVSPGDTFVDIGANHGSFSIVAGHCVGPDGRVLAFEPQPRLRALIQESLREIDGLQFETHGIACGDSSESAHLFVPRGSSGSAGLLPAYSARGKHRQIRVDARPLDAILAQRKFPGRMAVKIDVEGSEPAVLRGAAATVRRHRPSIVIELNRDAMAAANTNVGWFRDWFAGHGYERYSDVDGNWDDRRPIGDLGKTSHRNIVVWSPVRQTEADFDSAGRCMLGP